MAYQTPAPLFAPASYPKTAPQLSVVVPMHNEEGNAAALVAEIADAVQDFHAEIIVVDDASTDATKSILVGLKADFPTLRVLAHHKNAGQSRAVRTGILGAKGKIIATLDGDGQNLPHDISALYTQLKRDNAPDSLVMVAGERQGRQDSQAKLWASKAANTLRKKLLKDASNDTGCGIKVFYRNAFLRLPYFDHVHRYLPALMAREGFEVEFAPVRHRARAHGTSKYTNFGRAAVAFRDLMGVTWLIARSRNPDRIEEL